MQMRISPQEDRWIVSQRSGSGTDGHTVLRHQAGCRVTKHVRRSPPRARRVRPPQAAQDMVTPGLTYGPAYRPGVVKTSARGSLSTFTVEVFAQLVKYRSRHPTTPPCGSWCHARANVHGAQSCPVRWSRRPRSSRWTRRRATASPDRSPQWARTRANFPPPGVDG